jgi:uncharacterized membrane protein YbhN (UPF0104 family)
MEQTLKSVKMAQVLKLILRYGIPFLILFFLIAHIAENWNRLDEFTYKIDWTYLSLSILSLLASMLLLPLALRHIVGLLKYKISLKKMCMILFYSQIAKYLPGGIWGYVGRVYLYKREGMSGKDAFACVFLESILILISGIIVFCTSLFFGAKILSVEWMPHKYFSEIVTAAIVILLLMAHPKVLSLLWRWVPARFSEQELQLKYSYFSVLRPTLLMITFWLGVGGGLWLLVRSFYQMDLYLLPMAAGAYVLAWIMGFLAFFLPGGLGVREAVLVLSLSLYLPISISTISAIAARLWWVTGELSWTLLSLVWNGFESIRRVQNGGNSPGALKR